MRANRVSMAATVAIAVVCFVLTGAARADESQEQLRSALESMHSWVDSSDHGEGWRKFLRSSELSAQLNSGSGIDQKLLGEILAKYETDTPGLDRPRFVAVREALGAWLTQMNRPELSTREQLPEFVLASAQEFRPIPAQDVAAARKDVTKAITQLERYLGQGSANTQAWHAYLQWDALKEEMAKEQPDLKRLGGMYRLYVENYEGLELPVFSNIGDSLLRYGALATMSKQANLDAWYGQQIETLAKTLESYAAKPNNQDNETIGRILSQLESANQAEEVVAAVRRHYSTPNLLVRASSTLVGAGIARDVDQVDKITDNILGTSIHGTGHTVGHVSLQFVPNSEQAEMETVLSAKTTSKTVGYNGPVTIYAGGVTTIDARKKMLIDEDGISGLPATCQARTNSNVHSLDAGRIASKIAWKRIAQSKGKANRIAASHAEARVRGRLDREAAPMIADANKSFATHYRNPMLRLRQYPSLLKLTTDTDYLYVTALQANRSQIAAPSAPSELPGETDLAARVHETLMNNLIEGLLGGRTVNDDSMRQAIMDLRGELPEKFQEKEDQDPWSITFAKRDPITVSLDGNGFEITIRGSRYTSGDRKYSAMNVHAAYTFALTAEGALFTRQGQVEILPPGFKEGEDRLSASQLALTKILEKKFVKVFSEEIKAEGIELPGKWAHLGRLKPVELTSEAGWLNIAWNIEQPEKVASDSEKTVK